MFGLFAPGIVTLIIVISVFSWFYPARIVRAQVLSLREKEFVEAARMVGGRNFRIMRSHLLPHLVGTIIVYAHADRRHEHPVRGGAVVPRRRPAAARTRAGATCSSDAVDFYMTQPWLIMWPGLAILIMTLAVQPARRRPARRARPALDAVVSAASL